MPTTVPCPTCAARVKVPAEAERGREVVCPACDDRFVPGHLAAAGREPSPGDDGETYGALEAQGKRAPRERDDGYDTDRREKRGRGKRRKRAGTDADPLEGIGRKIWAGIALAVGLLMVLSSVVTFSMSGGRLPPILFIRSILVGLAGVSAIVAGSRVLFVKDGPLNIRERADEQARRRY